MFTLRRRKLNDYQCDLVYKPLVLSLSKEASARMVRQDHHERLSRCVCILVAVTFVLGYGALFGAAVPMSEPTQKLVRIDMARVAHKIHTIKKEQAAVLTRRVVAATVGIPAVAYAGYWLFWKEKGQNVPSGPNESVEHSNNTKPHQEFSMFEWQMKSTFYGALAGATVTLLFNKVSNIADRISGSAWGYFSNNTPSINELSQETAVRWRMLCDVLATYSGQTQAFAGTLAKHKKLSVFVTADVYTAYGSLMYTLERAMAHVLVQVAECDKTGDIKRACMQGFGHVAQSFNQSATMLEAMLHDEVAQKDQKTVEAFTRTFNAACIAFVNVVDQAQGVIGE